MDGSLSAQLDSELTSETQENKRRKLVQKTVVTVKIGENGGKLKNEGPPSDLWSWRKYGQKPIKGSPHPRGYYRCSTSKGCSAKKQVERSRTDASMLIITYTSTHNHPCPEQHHNTNNNLAKQPKQSKTQTQVQNSSNTATDDEPIQGRKDQEEETEQPIVNNNHDEDNRNHKEDHFHYLQSPISSTQDIMINQAEADPFTETNLEKINLLLDEEPISYENLLKFSTAKSEENDFFDELEELPISSAFTSFMKSNLFDERIPVVPS